MESSHSHNTGMAKIVHGMYSEYVPTQTATNGVRTTIDGFPIALFHRTSATSPMQYFGIYNFNDDKDNTDTFGYVSGTECWEVCNNTSKRTLFQISDYEIIGTDGNPEWYADFEARYPDKNRDYTNLKRLTDWIVSTDGDLDKFKNEFEQYFNLHYTLVYCVLTELFAMIDSRAKNMFLASWDKTIWYPVFYDMDSICGLNNEGELVFEYNVETNDTIGTQNVYNGKNSLLWQNFENAFSEEIKETYNALRDSDKLTYEKVLSILEGQQINILSEAQYNEDAKYKYLDPLLNDNISTYLYIAQGSRINHLKYWLFNRFNYMDSKYIASDYKNNYATMRLYTPENWGGVRPNSNFTITPFADQYSTVKFGSYVVSERSQADTPIEIVAPNIEFNDTETIIYGADRISNLGNLADKYAGTVDMSKATQLTELIIGSNANGYSNTNLKSVSVGNNKLLRKIDIRNCPSLTAPLDLSQCDSIQEVYTTGSSITSVKFSNGTELTTLTLPNTITNLTLINKKKLTSITSEGYENLNTLRIENSAINPFTIMNASPSLESVRLIGMNCQTSIAYVQYLATLKGMDENGVEIPLADAVSGKITIVECSRELLEEFKITFPNVIFNVLTFTTTWNVTFKDGDGNVIYTTKALNNGEVIYLGETPTKSQTVEYNYVWKGWDRQLKPIVSDCVINATFESVLRCYTVKFINSDTLDVVEEFILEYGSTIVYPNPPEGMNVWLPLDTIVTGDMVFYSKYIFYPDDLSIFEFNSFFMDNKTQYNVKLNTTNNLSAFLIYPFKDNNRHLVTSINGNTSLNVSAITDVYLPETIKYLGDYAFYNFNKITNLELLEVTNFINGNNIDSACRQFYGCSSLEEVKLPKMQKLPKSNSSSNAIFKNCTNLQFITMGSERYPFHTWEEYSSIASEQHFYGSTDNLIFINLVTENGLESDVVFNYTLSNNVKSKIIYSKTPIKMVTDDLGLTYIIRDGEATVTSYSGNATELNISEIEGSRVTKINENIFKGDTNLTTVSLPNATNLGEYCFYSCTSLTSIEIPNVINLGNYCFNGCTSLTSIEIPNATNLGEYCFQGCSNLTTIGTPNVTSLGNHCFNGCSNLTTVSFLNVTSLGSYCFNGCFNLTTIGIPNATILGNYCFYNCSKLALIEIPNVISLGKKCFYNCTSLASIEISNVINLNEYCFQGCSNLIELSLPKVKNIPTGMCSNCLNLSFIFIGNKDYTVTNVYGTTSSSSTANPFYNCGNGKIVVLNLVTENGLESDVVFSGQYITDDNTKLEIIYSKNPIEIITDNLGITYTVKDNSEAMIVNYSGSSTELNLSKINNIPIAKICEDAFSNNAFLKSVSLIDIPVLDNNCFSGCTNLTTVTLGKLGKSITNTSKIATNSFPTSVTKLNIYVEDATNPPTLTGSPWGATNATIVWRDINEITDNSGIVYKLKNNEITVLLYTGTATELSLSKINNIPITRINNCAFEGNTTLTTISLPNVTILGDHCFGGCTKLVTVTLGEYYNPIEDTNGFSSTAFSTSVKTLNIYTLYPDNPPTLTGSPWGATSATIYYKESYIDISKYFTYTTVTGGLKITGYSGNFVNIELSEINDTPVVEVGDDVFKRNTSLTSVSFPNVTNLGDSCFMYCTNLTSIEIPNVISLGENCFYGCSKLTTVSLPNVTSLGNYCFYNCTSLTTIEIPNAISLGGSCFRSCTSLTSISLPNATSLGSYCLNSCTNLTTIEIPNVTNLDNECFYDCKSLTSIEISNVTSLGDYCFYGCSALTSISLPNATSLGSYCLNSCTNLTTITLGGLRLPITNTSGFNSTAFDSTVTTLNIYVEDATNPPTLTGSPWGATSATIYYKSINEVTDDLGLTYIIKDGEATVTSYSGNVTELNISEIEGVPVTKVSTTVFRNNITITELSLPNVTSLGNYCFQGCSKLTSVEIPKTTSLGQYCFASCSKLNSIKMPRATSLGLGCFNGCSDLKTVTLGELGKPITSGGGFNSKAFSSTVTKLNIYVEDATNPPTLTGSPWGATNATIVWRDINEITDNSGIVYKLKNNEITVLLYTGTATELSLSKINNIPITRINNCAFEGNTTLTSVSFPNVISLGNSCFYGCSNLTSISLPKVTSLGNYCFNRCTNLTSISLSNATSLGNYCFYGCTKLTSIEIPNVTSLGNNCFYNCSKFTSISLPNVTSLGDSCFCGCTNLTSISLPNATSLGSYCFYSCANLKTVTLGGLRLPITNTSGFNSTAFDSTVTMLNIYVINASNPPTLAGSPWGAKNATIKYRGINEFTDDLGLTYALKDGEATIISYSGTATELNISEIEGVPVTKINNDVFKGNKTLTSVSFSNVTSIDSDCFYECSALTSISLPNVTSLGNNCFDSCSALTSISLPNVINLSYNCFYGCSKLTSVSLPNVTSLGSSCFKDCSALKSISLPEATSLGNSCFYGCSNLTSIEIPNATSLDGYCFDGCSKLTTISLPKATSLGSSCFSGCSALKTVTLGELGKPITNTSEFRTTAFSSTVTTLNIYVENATNPPTLTGSPWGATSATIYYKEA